jgi:hypothetical protein
MSSSFDWTTLVESGIRRTVTPVTAGLVVEKVSNGEVG